MRLEGERVRADCERLPVEGEGDGRRRVGRVDAVHCAILSLGLDTEGLVYGGDNVGRAEDQRRA